MGAHPTSQVSEPAKIQSGIDRAKQQLCYFLGPIYEPYKLLKATNCEKSGSKVGFVAASSPNAEPRFPPRLSFSSPPTGSKSKGEKKQGNDTSIYYMWLATTAK